MTDYEREPFSTEADIIAYFDKRRAEGVLQEAQDAVLFDGILNPADRELLTNLMFAIRNPNKALAPFIQHPDEQTQ